MPIVSTKHPKREQTFELSDFSGGYNEDRNPRFLDKKELAMCKNFKLVASADGRVTALLRQGTDRISATALPSAADVRACTYYVAQSKYILATATKLYYLDGSLAPVEIGTITGVPTFTEFHGKLIIHDTGVTKAWNGTTFETLNCYYAGEVLTTGNGSDTEYTDTLAHPTVAASTLTISFTDTTAKTITDNGTGRLTGNVDAAWVKNITGAADNGAGLIRITCGTHGYSTGYEINIAAVGGVTAANSSYANPTWTITVIDPDTFDLQSSVFAGSYTSGGTASRNTVIYTTGAIVYKCDGAPDNTTTITADYEKAAGAPKSSFGFVRASRLFVGGDSDNPSRRWHSGLNDEDAWDTSSDGGYIDIDPLDGSSLLGGASLFSSVIWFKGASIHREDAFPGDTDNAVVPMMPDVGAISRFAITNQEEMISFLSPSGWRAMSPSERYGDVQSLALLSKNFQVAILANASSNAITEYNADDNQLWLALYGSAAYKPYIYVINLNANGIPSTYQFKFAHSCFKYVDGKMLIGGEDGHLYRLTKSAYNYLDNAVSYASDSIVRTSRTDFGMGLNWKHNKAIELNIYGEFGLSGNVKLYKDEETTAFKTIALPSTQATLYIYDDGPGFYIYDDMQTMYIAPTSSGLLNKMARFNYKRISVEFTDIYGDYGAEIFGVRLTSAICGS